VGARVRAQALALVLAALTLAGCARERATPAAAPGAPADTGLSVTPLAPAAVAALAGDGGAPVTVLNVWASWCAPCREEMPALLAVARARRADGVRLALVSADFDSAAAHAFLARQGVDFPTWLKRGDDQSFIAALSPRWSGALPATFVYDASGRQVDFWEGAADSSRFDHAVAAALARGAAPR
jgi:thiol-disulfide isomerase/thioredoxin